jgi:hypothetical protein
LGGVVKSARQLGLDLPDFCDEEVLVRYVLVAIKEGNWRAVEMLLHSGAPKDPSAMKVGLHILDVNKQRAVPFFVTYQMPVSLAINLKDDV